MICPTTLEITLDYVCIWVQQKKSTLEFPLFYSIVFAVYSSLCVFDRDVFILCLQIKAAQTWLCVHVCVFVWVYVCVETAFSSGLNCCSLVEWGKFLPLTEPSADMLRESCCLQHTQTQRGRWHCVYAQYLWKCLYRCELPLLLLLPALKFLESIPTHS